MKKYHYGLFAVLLFGLIAFSEGKPCPGRTRPHKTRCDAYYKCTELNTNKHVWVPARCEEGLIYEHSLEVCVLPADDWECGQKSANEKPTKSPNRNNQNQIKDADVYIVSNSENEMDENMINDRYEDDGKVEIIIGTGIDSEEEGNEDDVLFDGSGNGGELVELDDLMKAETRETDDVVMLKDDNDKPKPDLQEMEKKEELNEMLQTIKTKAEIGQPSTNIDPKLTAHLQRLSQLIDGLKQTYQTQDEKQPMQDLRPDQLNAFLAHFNIKNKFDNLDPNGSQEKTTDTTTSSSMQSNHTANYKNGMNKKLSPETKVVLSNHLPSRYVNQHSVDGSSSGGGGYSNSQIVVNRPEGAVLFSLPAEHHFVDQSEYSSDNSPKISENTLKTVLELSKQMIASQNVPNVIQNPAYYAPPIMQPILLTPHMESPFSSNYYGGRPGQQVDSSAYQSVFSSDYNNQNYNYNKKPEKRPQQNPTTIIHNNVIPVHVTSTGSGDKEIIDSYGQSLYPPFDPQAERPDTDNAYQDHSQHSSYENNNYQTTKRPQSLTSTSSPGYGNTHRPFDFQPTSATFNKYFTPSEHLNNHNVNNVFQTTDNYGNIVRPMKNKRPNHSQQQSYKPSGQGDYDNQEDYDSSFSQVNANQAYKRPNVQPMYSDDQLQQQQPQYPDSVDDDDSDITFSYGQKNPFQVNGNVQLQHTGSSSQSVFSSSNNPYMSRPSSSHSSMPSLSGSYLSSSNKNKYSSMSSGQPYHEGAQLVNVGGNFINFDVFQNSILPLMGGNAPSTNVEVITCAAGVRQANTSDCTRYYVCSKKDGKVLSYSCPPYTAFNGETRICDARTYALCNPDSGMPITYSVSENKRIQMETLKALQEAKRKQAMQQQQQAMQAQQLANMFQQYTPQSSMSSNHNPLAGISSSSVDSGEQNMLQSYMQQAAAMASVASTTARPYMPAPTSKKRKYYCKEGDKIADQTSISSYFVCFKNAQGQMKGHKMTCSKGLLFCPKSTMCTLPSKCS